MKLEPNRAKWLIAGCLAHAAVITAIWILVFKFDVEVVPSRVWMGVALIWPLWAIAAALSPRMMVKAWVATGALGLVVLMPAIPTLYTFIAWSIGGFAP